MVASLQCNVRFRQKITSRWKITKFTMGWASNYIINDSKILFHSIKGRIQEHAWYMTTQSSHLYAIILVGLFFSSGCKCDDARFKKNFSSAFTWP
mmetsp:Transcript_19254/g.41857  ORF Transcript_19254/g.41857 Transcript_19254/m.41857 type:complete len:95 (-) Transcript_19254:252-536(-)